MDANNAFQEKAFKKAAGVRTKTAGARDKTPAIQQDNGQTELADLRVSMAQRGLPSDRFQRALRNRYGFSIGGPRGCAFGGVI